MKRARVPEKVVQSHIVTLLCSIGARVYVLGRPSPNDGRAHRGTGQSAGVPDLWVFLPAPRVNATVDPGGVDALWIEVKAAGGRRSLEQAVFGDQCAQVGVPYVCGDLDAVIAWLVARGYVQAESLPHYRRPTS